MSKNIDHIKKVISALQKGDKHNASVIIQNLIESKVELGPRWMDISRLALAIGEYDLAIEAAKYLISLGSQNSNTHVQLATVLVNAGKTQEALNILDGLRPHQSEIPSIEHFKGSVHSQNGDFSEAKKCFNIVLSSWKLSSMTWMSLAEITDFSTDAKMFERLESLDSQMSHTSKDNYGVYLYALAKAHHDCLQYNKASTLYQKGAQFISKERTYNHAVDINFSQNVFSNHAFSSPHNLESKLQPIFIMGNPRSGTTLVEQILLSHSKINGGAELNQFMNALHPSIISTLSARKPISKIENTAWKATANRYHHLVKQSFGNSNIFVDKTLNNGQIFALLYHTFPKAKFIWVRRSDEDTALSAFRTYFSKGLDWSWSLENISKYFKLQDQYFKFWQEQYPGVIHEIRYDDLTRSPENTIAVLLEYCQLQKEVLHTHFYKAKAAIATASLLQVRQPLHQNSVGKSKQYPELLAKFSNIHND